MASYSDFEKELSVSINPFAKNDQVTEDSLKICASTLYILDCDIFRKYNLLRANTLILSLFLFLHKTGLEQNCTPYCHTFRIILHRYLQLSESDAFHLIANRLHSFE